MSYELIIEDSYGDAVDALPACSNGCIRDVFRYHYGEFDTHNNDYESSEMIYPQWEPEFDTWCLGCGVIIGGSSIEDGTEGCKHRYPIVVNRLTVDLAEVCEHGVTIQQPRSNTIWEDGTQ